MIEPEKALGGKKGYKLFKNVLTSVLFKKVDPKSDFPLNKEDISSN